MAKQKKSAKSSKASKPAKAPAESKFRTCALPPVPERRFDAPVDPRRAQLIRINDRKWLNGTTLHYYFFDRPGDGPNGRWVGAEKQRAVVRKAFKAWKDLGLGLEFEEVARREDAEIRVAFDQTDGSWSYVGRDIVDFAKDPDTPTINFGWDLTTPYGWDTALHEIGHTLGFPHEHQNPKTGIVWNEPKVYAYFRGSPNFWDDQTIQWNILRKLPAATVTGSDWDRNSIMHYAFPAGMIDNPPEFKIKALEPEPGLSKVDIREAKNFYPSLEKSKDAVLTPFRSQPLTLGPGQQANFRIRPPYSRRYTIQTFGVSDSVIALFEDTRGGPRFLAGDDDSGAGRNARLVSNLQVDREYILRVRLYYAQASGETAVMLW